MIDTVQKECDEFKVIKCNPKPYVICKSEDAEVINLIEERDGITLTVNQLKCVYMTSQPTGDTNLAVSVEYLDRFKSKTGIVNNYNLEPKPNQPQDDTCFMTSAEIKAQA